MLAFFHEQKPYIYTLDFPLGSITKATTHFAAIGHGGILAAYLLKEYTNPEMDSELGIAIAVYIIETVRKHDQTVGGPTRVAIIAKPHQFSRQVLVPRAVSGLQLPSFHELWERCALLPQNNVDEIAQLVSKVDAAMKKSQNQKLKGELKRQSEKRIKAMLGDMYDDMDELYSDSAKENLPAKKQV